MSDGEVLDGFQIAEESRAAALTAMWNEGVPVAEIGQALGGLTKGSVVSWARRLGLPTHANAPPPTKWTSRRVFQLKGYIAAGMNPTEIARAFGDIDVEPVRRAVRTLREGGDIKVTDYEWTDEREAELRRLWLEGVLTRAIADKLGTTDAMVSAQVDRLRKRGVPMPARSTVPPKRGGLKQPDFANVPGTLDNDLAVRLREPRALTPSSREQAIAEILPATDDPLSTKGCRWPVGDPRAINSPQFGAFRFCQHAKGAGGRPYCEAHAAIAYARPAPAKRKRQTAATFANGGIC